MNKLFNSALFFGSILLSTLITEAKTNVYVFVPKMGNTDISLMIDGEKKCSLNAPIVKTMNNEMFKIPMKQSQAGWVEIEFENEGKVLLSISAVYTNFMNLTKTTMQGEIQLDLQDDEPIYIDMARKGWSDMQLKVLNAKKGEKKLADKKAYEFPKLVINND